jgi:hypothetical protein
MARKQGFDAIQAQVPSFFYRVEPTRRPFALAPAQPKDELNSLAIFFIMGF